MTVFWESPQASFNSILTRPPESILLTLASTLMFEDLSVGQNGKQYKENLTSMLLSFDEKLIKPLEIEYPTIFLFMLAKVEM